MILTVRGAFFFSYFFFFNDTATTEIYTLSLHDALPICSLGMRFTPSTKYALTFGIERQFNLGTARSEEHTSELQSHLNLVCRLLLEKKNSSTNPPVLLSYADL